MTIYEHKTSMVVAGGSSNTTTLRIVGGLARYLMIRANTATTLFMANLQDDAQRRRLDYGIHEGEIIDAGLCMPMVGSYAIHVTNANPNNDTFTIVLSVQE